MADPGYRRPVYIATSTAVARAWHKTKGIRHGGVEPYFGPPRASTSRAVRASRLIAPPTSAARPPKLGVIATARSSRRRPGRCSDFPAEDAVAAARSVGVGGAESRGSSDGELQWGREHGSVPGPACYADDSARAGRPDADADARARPGSTPTASRRQAQTLSVDARRRGVEADVGGDDAAQRLVDKVSCELVMRRGRGSCSPIARGSTLFAFGGATAATFAAATAERRAWSSAGVQLGPAESAFGR